LTTQLMIDQLAALERWLPQKKVLDFGAGTGILGILAGKLGASEVTLIDIEPWAVENCHENIAANYLPNCQLQALQGDLSIVPTNQTFDCILANINRNVLVESVTSLQQLINPNGKLIVSGFFDFDAGIILESYTQAGFRVYQQIEKNGWTCIAFDY
ncbi:MAG: 50S ribosomal protein L11 methyltransferase, partial [Bacteroidia bacterium]|nr:50S ribosomal protein L11 methyltransferase [Bacteroidia bacterium]